MSYFHWSYLLCLFLGKGAFFMPSQTKNGNNSNRKSIKLKFKKPNTSEYSFMKYLSAVQKNEKDNIKLKKTA